MHVCAADNCKQHTTLAEAQASCAADSSCGGINAGPYASGAVCCYNTRQGTGYIPTWPCPGTTNHLNSSGWLVTNAGKDGCRAYTGSYVPPPPPPPACHTSLECRQGGTRFDHIRASYCQLPATGRGPGTCVGGGGSVFSANKVLGIPATNYSEMQAGVLGGYLRIASVGNFDRATQRGFEMMALGASRSRKCYCAAGVCVEC